MSGSVAFVFPGQGSQSVGMGAALALASPAAAGVFAQADRALGESISAIAWEGPAEVLDLTVNAQPALLATSIAYLEAIRERRAAGGLEPLRPSFVAGHSMGQYSAMVATGSLSLAEAMRLVRERGRLMQASGQGRPGAMAAVIGLDDELLPDLIEAGSGHGILTIANRNAPGQVVISGERAAVDAAASAARSLGARRVIELPVSVAAHSPLMAEAAEGMARLLAQVPFADPRPVLLANADARPLATGAEARAELVEHLTRGVDWVAAVRSMSAAGVTSFVEIGPGRILTGLIKRIVPEAEAVSTDDPNAPDRLAMPAPDPAADAAASA